MVVFFGRKRRLKAERHRAIEMRQEAETAELDAWEGEAEAARAEADVQQAEVDAERPRREALESQEDALTVREGMQERVREGRFVLDSSAAAWFWIRVWTAAYRKIGAAQVRTAQIGSGEVC